MIQQNKSNVANTQSAMVSQFCVRPTSRRWFSKRVQVTMRHGPLDAMQESMSTFNIHLAFTYRLQWSLKHSVKQWSGKTDGQFIISRWISPHGRSKYPTIGWQSACNFNPPAISRWTRKCPRIVAYSSCELLDFSRKKYSNIGQQGNGNRYPPGHEHG